MKSILFVLLSMSYTVFATTLGLTVKKGEATVIAYNQGRGPSTLSVTGDAALQIFNSLNVPVKKSDDFIGPVFNVKYGKQIICLQSPTDLKKVECTMNLDLKGLAHIN